MFMFLRFSPKQHLWFALFLGLTLRLVAAWSGWGWFSPDDYEFGIEQAYHWLHQPEAAFGCDFRSPLLSILMWALMWLPFHYGEQRPDMLVHWAFSGLALITTSLIYSGYRVAKVYGAKTQVATAYLLACFFILPYISTRPMYEVVAMAPLTLSVDGFHRARIAPTHQCRFYAAWGGFALGLATLLRFHAGILFAVIAGLFLWDYRSAKAVPESKQRWRQQMAGWTIGVALTAMMQAYFDSLLQRPWGATPWRYLQFNLAYAHTYGTSPIYTYVLHFLSYTLPPLTLWLLRPLTLALWRHSTLNWFLGVFVVVHSLIGHKEDRFMFPVLPLFLIALAHALVCLQQSFHQRWVTQGFWLVNSFLLAIAVFADGHRNITTPLLHLSQQPHAAAATVGLSAAPRFYAGDTPLLAVDSIAALHRFLAMTPQQRLTHILLGKPPQASELAALAQLPRHFCHTPKIYSGDWVDRWLVRLNHHNAGRAPTALLSCAAIP